MTSPFSGVFNLKSRRSVFPVSHLSQILVFLTLRYLRSHTPRAVGVVGLIPCFAEVTTAHNQALILGPLRLEAHSPYLFFSSSSFGTQAFTPCPLGGVGSQQEVDFAIDQKRELWYQWKEGASIAQRTSGERMCVQGRYYLPQPPTGIQSNFSEGPYTLYSLKKKLLLLAT